MKTVDLNNCVKGDVLISKHGAVLQYVKKLEDTHYYDHEVEYLILDGKLATDFGNGTRNNDGTVFKNNKLDIDHDIIEIIPYKIFKKLIKVL